MSWFDHADGQPYDVDADDERRIEQADLRRDAEHDTHCDCSTFIEQAVPVRRVVDAGDTAE